MLLQPPQSWGTRRWPRELRQLAYTACHVGAGQVLRPAAELAATAAVQSTGRIWRRHGTGRRGGVRSHCSTGWSADLFQRQPLAGYREPCASNKSVLQVNSDAIFFANEKLNEWAGVGRRRSKVAKLSMNVDQVNADQGGGCPAVVGQPPPVLTNEKPWSRVASGFRLCHSDTFKLNPAGGAVGLPATFRVVRVHLFAPPRISETTGRIRQMQTVFDSPLNFVEGNLIALTSGSPMTSQVRSKRKCSPFTGLLGNAL